MVLTRSSPFSGSHKSQFFRLLSQRDNYSYSATLVAAANLSDGYQLGVSSSYASSASARQGYFSMRQTFRHKSSTRASGQVMQS